MVTREEGYQEEIAHVCADREPQHVRNIMQLLLSLLLAATLGTTGWSTCG